jgi:DNA-binding transcriptional MocR family regulator
VVTEVVTFDGAPPPGTINFGVGQPSADLLPVDLVRTASESFLARAQPFDLNYGVPRGDARFLESLAAFLSANYGSAATADDLFVTGGNSQAMDMVSTVFAKPGDTVFVEEPSYFLAFQIFRDHGLNIVGIPMDESGPRIEALEQALTMHSPAFLYTIPSFHNPTGHSSSASRRQDIVRLARKHKFLIVADEPYQLLHYFDKPPPAYGTMTDSGVVISLGSFSKILAPAMRLGWIQTSNAHIEKLLTKRIAVVSKQWMKPFTNISLASPSGHDRTAVIFSGYVSTSPSTQGRCATRHLSAKPGLRPAPCSRVNAN